MKVFAIICLAAGCPIAFGQSGAGIGSPGPSFSDQTPAQRAKFEQDVKNRIIGTNIFRVVTNQPFNVQKSDLWKPISGIVDGGNSKLVVIGLRKDFQRTGQTILLRNFSGEATFGISISAVAMRVGTDNSAGLPLELWDCGVPYQPKPLVANTNPTANVNRPPAQKP